MEAGSSEEAQHLLVVLVDISDAFNRSAELEDVSQRVRCLAI